MGVVFGDAVTLGFKHRVNQVHNMPTMLGTVQETERKRVQSALHRHSFSETRTCDCIASKKGENRAIQDFILCYPSLKGAGERPKKEEIS